MVAMTLESNASGSQDSTASVVVSVSLSPNAAPAGEIGCALFSAAPGFPLDGAKAITSGASLAIDVEVKR
jgi:hypothetical protein